MNDWEGAGGSNCPVGVEWRRSMGHFTLPLPRERTSPSAPLTQASVSHSPGLGAPLCPHPGFVATVPPLSTSVSPWIPQRLGAHSTAARGLAAFLAAVPAPRRQPPRSAPARLWASVTSCPVQRRPCHLAAATETFEPWSRWRTPRAAQRRWQRRQGSFRAGGRRSERGGAGGARPLHRSSGAPSPRCPPFDALPSCSPGPAPPP